MSALSSVLEGRRLHSWPLPDQLPMAGPQRPHPSLLLRCAHHCMLNATWAYSFHSACCITADSHIQCSMVLLHIKSTSKPVTSLHIGINAISLIMSACLPA